MALSIAEADTVSSKYFDPTLTNNIYEGCPFYIRLKQKNRVKVRGGTSIQFGIRYRELGKADAIGPREQMTYEQLETRTGADVPWRYYTAHAMISWDERVKNTGTPKVISLIKDKLTEMKEDLDDRFATDIYTANPRGDGIESIANIVHATSTYAGIATADVSVWAAGSTDASTTVLALYGAGSLSKMTNDSTFGKDKPTMHLTTRDLFSRFMAKFEGQKVYEDRELANAGFNNIKFMDAPIVGDVYCPASTWYGLDMEHFELVVHPDFNFKMTGWKELDQVGFNNAMKRVISFTGNVKCTMRQTSFKYTTLDYTK